MSVNGGPNISENGLIFSVDAADKTSYPGTGTAWNDLVGSNNGTLTNGPLFNTDGKGSIVFDGTNDYTAFGNIDLSQTNKVSVSFWCKILSYPEAPNTGYLIFESSTNFNNSTTGFLAAYSDNSNSAFLNQSPLLLALKGNSGYNIPAFDKNLVNDLQWHYYVCIFDKTQTTNNECRLYLDGILRTPIFYPSGLMTENSNNFGNDPLFFGSRSGASSGQGNTRLSNFQMYNRVLNADEVLQNYNNTKSRFGL